MPHTGGAAVSQTPENGPTELDEVGTKSKCFEARPLSVSVQDARMGICLHVRS